MQSKKSKRMLHLPHQLALQAPTAHLSLPEALRLTISAALRWPIGQVHLPCAIPWVSLIDMVSF